jgi:hypothetical protein
LSELTTRMRRFLFTALAICFVTALSAQDTTARSITRRLPKPVAGGNDHFMVQLGYTTWNGKPDSIRTGGFSRSFNVYFMFAFPFRTNPHLSAAIGPGIASDHILLDKMRVGITDRTANLEFRDVSDTNYFKKYKLSTSWLEVPIELRYSSKPFDDARSIKVAVGAKVATMLSAWTKANDLADRNGNTINDYTEKLKSKRFFNTTRLSLTARAGYGHFTLFTSYAVTPLLKEGVGPTLRPWTIGLTLSGL